MRVWIEIPAKDGAEGDSRPGGSGTGMEWGREMDWVRGLMEGARSAATLVMAAAKAMVRSHMIGCARVQRPAGALLGSPRKGGGLDQRSHSQCKQRAQK